MNPKPIVRTPLTKEQLDEAALLKHLYTAAQHGLSQAEFGASFDIGSQGAVWQYLNGRTAINLKAAKGFAKGLNCNVSDFSPRLAAEIEGLARHAMDSSAPAQAARRIPIVIPPPVA